MDIIGVKDSVTTSTVKMIDDNIETFNIVMGDMHKLFYKD